MTTARKTARAPAPGVLRLPRLPAGVSATDILEGRAFTAFEAERWNDSPRRKVVGRSTTTLSAPQPATAAWLRRMGVAPEEGPARIAGDVRARVRDPRRPNPRRPESVDEFILGLLALCIRDEGADAFVRREGIARYLQVPEHVVSQSLERLNKRSFLGPERNAPPPGSHRSTARPGRDSAWQGSIREPRMDVLAAYFDSVRFE